ncbi:glycosyltransferase family 2 protein [Limnohabitans sp. Jir72]|uniref:glycosyltransferase family 2 protein n=1 Tax=Limnohabitans sp. Jir72 TaxID=1977909 RepID=UPI000D398EDC|nr:glycosyltransferase family 2 protein [Limnohabitans sp. Jir72]PUE33368.1 glycosyltransferase [Limnohabitans sp. Jir72]
MHKDTLRIRPQNPRISCVIPAYNEALNLPMVLPAIWQQIGTLTDQFEIIVVNDGSRDNTFDVACALAVQYPGIVALDLSRNFGKEAAMTAGLEAAAGDVVILMDADGQHPVALLPTMLQKWQDGVDVVYAIRRTRDDQSSLHATLTGWFYRLVNWGSRVKIPRDAGDFRLMDKQVVAALVALPERNRFMKGLYAWVGFSNMALDYEPLPRQQGVSNFGLLGAFRLALTGMLAFSTVPLRLLTVSGLLLSLASMLYIAWVFVEYFYRGIQVPGYATLVVSIMFFSGIQLLALGIMSEYVGRIYDEVKRRPLYLLKQRTGHGLERD